MPSGDVMTELLYQPLFTVSRKFGKKANRILSPIKQTA